MCFFNDISQTRKSKIWNKNQALLSNFLFSVVKDNFLVTEYYKSGRSLLHPWQMWHLYWACHILHYHTGSLHSPSYGYTPFCTALGHTVSLNYAYLLPNGWFRIGFQYIFSVFHFFWCGNSSSQNITHVNLRVYVAVAHSV